MKLAYEVGGGARQRRGQERRDGAARGAVSRRRHPGTEVPDREGRPARRREPQEVVAALHGRRRRVRQLRHPPLPRSRGAAAAGDGGQGHRGRRDGPPGARARASGGTGNDANGSAGSVAAQRQCGRGGCDRGRGGQNHLDGVFSAAQVKRGREVYARACSACHLDTLAGDAVSPPLTGPGSWAATPDSRRTT